ncbi:MAG: Asp-tRNA(Asn)/Glu-tRNA(Gln) amidotransferase subunit GatA [Candidatus Paceibacterota bacterium]
MKIDLDKMTIAKAHDHLIKKDFSVRELCQAYLDEIEKRDKTVHAYLELYDDLDEQIEEAQKMIDAGTDSVLAGIPLALKDNILVKGKKASASSKILENYTATYDSTVATRLKEAGVVFLGRTNMDEFAMGSSTETSAYGVTRNPLDESRVPGGSSGGAAASVAMHGALASLGSDTAGSVRQPASFCGVVGLKTTYGSVSRYGLMAMGSSLDQIGPITRSVTDAEILFNTIRGHDAFDSTTLPNDLYKKMQAQPLKSKKPVIGVPRDMVYIDGLDPEVRANFDQSIKKLESLGYEIKDIELPHIKYSLPAYYIIMPGEVSSNLARFDGVKFGLHVDGKNLLEDYKKTRGKGFGKEVRRRILVGTHVLSSGYYDAYYNKAQNARKLIIDDFTKAFEKVDVIITPTTPTPAFKLGEKKDNPVEMYLADIFTVPANIARIPALSVPSGFVKKDGVDLPLGLQFMSAECREDILFAVGKEFLNE